MDEERIRILQMLKDGKISIDESLELLEALDAGEPKEPVQPKAKWMRIRVTELGKEKPKVLLNLPISIVDWALKTGGKIANLSGADLNGMGVNLEDLRVALVSGMRGKILDVEDESERTHVEIEIE